MQGAVEQLDELRPVAGGAAPVTAERERRAQDHGERELERHFVMRGHDRRLRHLQAGESDGLAEELAVLGPADHIGAGADQLDSESVEHSFGNELHRQVQCGLAAERGQQRIGALAA